MEVQETNWELVRNRYEFSDTSIEDLARDFDLPVPVVKEVVVSQQWRKKSIIEELDFQQLDQQEKIETLKRVLADEFLVTELLKNKALQGQTHLLENVFLLKTIEVIRCIDSTSALAANQMAVLARGIEAFYRASRREIEEKAKEDVNEATQVVVNVLAQAS